MPGKHYNLQLSNYPTTYPRLSLLCTLDKGAYNHHCCADDDNIHCLLNCIIVEMYQVKVNERAKKL